MLALVPTRRVLVTLALLLCDPAAGSEVDTIMGEVGGNVTLPCRNASLGTDKVDWFKIGNDHPVLSLSWPTWNVRFEWGNQSSLQIKELQLEDEGNYTCMLVSSGNPQPQIQLLLAFGPSHTSVSLTPSRILPNGTFYAPINSIIQFACATNSYPDASMTWVFSPLGSPSENFASANSTFLNFTLLRTPPSFQGNYSCLVRNWLNLRMQKLTVEFLVYVLPKSPPECWAETSQAGFLVDLHCAWQGGYPHPVFQWRDGEKVLGQSESSTAGLGSMDHFAVTLDRSHLQSGKQFECRVIHILQQEPQTCTIRTTLPTLEPHPMEVCFSGGNVTLVCLTTSTNPPANFTWLKNINEPRLEIQPNEKYQITQNATSSLLTIHNCSRDIDEGYYVCRAENPLGVRELDVWLAVRSQRNIVGIVTALVILFIFAIGSITILILYCNPEFCLKVRSR
ncbi:V-set and immunoglobulin domain-containing protein 10 isoform X1 [Pleurodeles waltl]